MLRSVCLSLALVHLALMASPGLAQEREAARPNILFAISDDQSWMHTGANGDASIRTPAFDRVAREGVRFVHAFTAAPSCTPSRGAILTGQALWRLGAGGVLHGSLPAELPVYPRLLEAAGYHVGFTGKGWGPGDLRAAGRSERPEGQPFQRAKLEAQPPGRSRNDYAANFSAFLQAREGDQPFCFWFGASEPHRTYDAGSGARAGKALGDAALPASLPDVAEVRADVLDYTVEIEHFDAHLARMLATLEARGELDRTLIVVTSDHGMPFPRAKANLYDEGTRVPLAVRWPDAVAAGRVAEDFVSLTDLAPTFLAACGVTPPAAMTGRSLLPLLHRTDDARIDPSRDHVVFGIEQHVPAREGFVGYPMRGLRTAEFLFVWNPEPQRWPAGDPPPFYITEGRAFADVDDGPTKRYLLAHPEHPRHALAFGRRPVEELYDLGRDPEQMHNVAADPDYRDRLAGLRQRLHDILRSQGDPRENGSAPWERFPVHAGYLRDNAAFARTRQR